MFLTLMCFFTNVICPSMIIFNALLCLVDLGNTWKEYKEKKSEDNFYPRNIKNLYNN